MFDSNKVLPIDRQVQHFDKTFTDIFNEILATGHVKAQRDNTGIAKAIVCLPFTIPISIVAYSSMCACWCVSFCCCHKVNAVMGEAMTDGIGSACNPCKDQRKLMVETAKKEYTKSDAKYRSKWSQTDSAKIVFTRLALMYNNALQERVKRNEYNSITYSLAEYLCHVLSLWATSRGDILQSMILDDMHAKGYDYKKIDMMVQKYTT